jgi:hypothetical protein
VWSVEYLVRVRVTCMKLLTELMEEGVYSV